MQQRRLCTEARSSQRACAEMLANETKRVIALEAMRVSDAKEIHALECARAALQEEAWTLRETMAAGVVGSGFDRSHHSMDVSQNDCDSMPSVARV